MYRRAFLSTWDADDDLAFFSKGEAAACAEEWAKGSPWVRGAEPSVLWRSGARCVGGGYEALPDGRARARVWSAVATRRFEAGEIVLVLSRIDTPKQPTPEGEAEEEARGGRRGRGRGGGGMRAVEVSLDLGSLSLSRWRFASLPRARATAPLETWYDRPPFAGYNAAAAAAGAAPPPDVVVVEEEGEEEGDDAEEEEAAAAPAAD